MRVLYLSNSPKLGGANRYLQILLDHLPREEVSPFVVGPAEGEMAQECRRAGIPFDVIPYLQPSWRGPLTTIRGEMQWYQEFRRIRPDLIHSNDFFDSRSVGLAAAALSVPTICHVHFPLEPAAIEWMFARLPKPAVFLYNSHSTMAEVDEVIHRTCPRAKRTVIHNCIELRTLEAAVDAPDSRPLRVAIVANLLRVKGHRDFLRMAGHLNQRGIDAEYWIIGAETVEIGYEAGLKRLSSEMKLEQSIRFLGYRSDVSRLLEEIDVLVCASHVEPFGICNLEAMERGVPVVGTSVGGIPEVVVDGSTGFLVPPGRPELLAEKVAYLLSNPKMRLELGQAGRERVGRLFDARTHAERILRLYRETIQRDCLDDLADRNRQLER